MAVGAGSGVAVGAGRGIAVGAGVLPHDDPLEAHDRLHGRHGARGVAVTAAPSALSDADGPRISISFNYAGDDALEEGRHAWGQVTAGLDALALEEGLHLQAEGAESG